MQFIEYREIECTALMEKILSSTEDVFVLENSLNKKFCALFFLRNKSTIFHFIPFLTENKNPDYNFSENQKKSIEEIICNFLHENKIFCIYGESVGNEYLKNLMTKNQKKIIASNDYILMKNDFSNFDFTDFENKSKVKMNENLKELKVTKCSILDLNKLMDLEKGYREEEVQISEHGETPQVIRFVLNKSLNSQEVFAAWKSDGEKLVAIAKAATNANGKNYYQIGGVYCDKKFRNKGIANFVMQHLLYYIHQKRKIANLFVKINNEPAKKLYANLGFVSVGKYQIAYFQK